MSPGCSDQDPEQPQVASGDLAGLLLDILAMIESWYYNYIFLIIIMLLDRSLKNIRDFVLRFNFRRWEGPGYRKLSYMVICQCEVDEDEEIKCTHD